MEVGLFVVMGVLGLIVGTFFFSAWIIMLLWGALGSTFDFFTIGFWAACLITFVLGVISSILK